MQNMVPAFNARIHFGVGSVRQVKLGRPETADCGIKHVPRKDRRFHLSSRRNDAGSSSRGPFASRKYHTTKHQQQRSLWLGEWIRSCSE
ncbi:hypothetical protein Pla144_06650 [Bythopirellula polymerisocia]|uniref:Uncharacterized protein n=1 Tax=Bythopirellula polymerisocia TaxID=2528003 RepID=A0A5C6D124_9BACT|nr:hypothetical protein Pla144_06650 [Bythopirellula polymerisocia]